MLTSEGRTRAHADSSHARWCYLQGKTGTKETSILVTASPANLNYPEPLRVWNNNVNVLVGDIMWNFSLTKEKPFTLQPGKTLELAYWIYVLEKSLIGQQRKSWQKTLSIKFGKQACPPKTILGYCVA